MTFDEAQRSIALSSIKKVLREYTPESVYSMLVQCGLPLKLVDSGQFRNVFEVIGTGYVIKFPIPEEDGGYEGYNLLHCVVEFNAWKRLRKSTKYKAVRKYLPFFHYFDYNSGLALLEKLAPLKHDDRRYDADIKLIHSHLKACGHKDSDLNHDKWDNYGIDPEGNLKILDFGCIVEDGE